MEAGGDRTASEGTLVQVAATFADPGAADTHTATIDWGDGTGTQLVQVNEASGAGTVIREPHAMPMKPYLRRHDHGDGR